MKFQALALGLCALMICVGSLSAQSQLTTTFAGGNGCSGNFFDIQAQNDVTICSFDVSLDAGVTTPVEVWAVTGGGTHVGIENDATQWTLLATVAVTSAGLNTPTPLDVQLNYPIPSGTTQGFYIRTTASTNINYTNGTTLGAVFASDGNIAVLEGRYSCALTGFTLASTTLVRVWNGNVIYLNGLGGGCPAAFARPWQTNSLAASLTINGLLDPGFLQPITAVVGGGSMDSFDFASTQVGLPFDTLITFPEAGVALGAGGFATAGNQTVNINFFAPSLFALNGLGFTAPFTGNFSVAANNLPVGLQVSAQSVHINPANLPDLFNLSHLVRYEIEACNPQQDFENLARGTGSVITGAGPYPVGWSNGTGTRQWQVWSGTTTSSTTGPLTGAFSGNQYMYCETSGGQNSVFEMQTCNYDLATLSTFTLNFRLSRLGATIGTLDVLMDDGTGTFATTIATYTGPEANGLDWTAESISLLPFITTSTVAFRFRYTSGTSLTGDIAIDAFDLQ